MSTQKMAAVVVRETGGKGAWNELAIDEVPRPVLKAGEVLVQVEACSVNRADLLQRRGLYPPPPGSSEIMGLDFAGFIVAADSDLEGRHMGDRVFGVAAGGGYGRYIAVPADHLVSIPPNLSFIEAAAAAEVFFTAYLNLFQEAKIQPREVLLIHGGGSGVGTSAIQLARAAGIRTIITAGSGDKIDRCLRLGADHGINYKSEDFVSRIRELTHGGGVDVILDPIGAAYLGKHIEILNLKGRLVIIGLMGGNKADIQLAPLLTKRLRIIGSVLRSRSKEEKAELTGAFKKHVLPLLASGTIHPVIDRVYTIDEVESAHRHMLEGEHFGKIVLTWQRGDRAPGE